MIHKPGLYTLSLQYEREYSSFCVVSVAFCMHEISCAISLKIKSQVFYWVETVSKKILFIG